MALLSADGGALFMQKKRAANPMRVRSPEEFNLPIVLIRPYGYGTLRDCHAGAYR